MSPLVRNSVRLLLPALAFVFAALPAGPALAARGLPSNVELDGLVSKRPVRDTIVEDSGRAIPARIETFIDPHGHPIRIGTDIAGLELAPYAAVLGETLHGAEISAVLVEVVPWATIELACGADAVGCYYPSGRLIVVPDHDPAGSNELVHTIVHEYGHHVDRELENLGHLDSRCRGRDGSRSWWWVRVPDSFSCVSPTWELRIGELFAEDYTAAHGIVGWGMSTIGPPSPFVQSRIARDFRMRFLPRTLARAGFVRRHRVRSWSFAVRHWTWLTATLRGPRSADLDLLLFRRGATRPLRRSERRGSSERVRYTLRPGVYRIAVWAARGGGRATVRIALD